MMKNFWIARHDKKEVSRKTADANGRRVAILRKLWGKFKGKKP